MSSVSNKQAELRRRGIKVREKISEYDLQGYSQQDIAQLIGISPQAVSKHMMKIDEERIKNTFVNREASIQNQLLSLEMLERKTMRAFNRSTQDAVMVTDEESEKFGSKKTTKRTGQAGDAALASVILGIHKRRAELLGLDAPKKVEQVIRGERPSDGEPTESLIDTLRERYAKHLLSKMETAIPGPTTEHLNGSNGANGVNGTH